MGLLSDHEYAKFAKGDKDWIQIVTSARIEGIDAAPRDDVLAGKYLRGDITQGQWSEAIHAQKGYELKPTKTEAWLKRVAPLVHRMSHDEAYRLDVATRLS